MRAWEAMGSTCVCLHVLVSLVAFVQASPVAPTSMLRQHHVSLHSGHRLLRLRGGSSKGKNQPEAIGGGMSEERLQLILGKSYTLDMSVSGNAEVLARLVRTYQQGKGEFNGVRLDGQEYKLWSVTDDKPKKQDEEDSDEEGEDGEKKEKVNSDKFRGMRGKAAFVYQEKDHAKEEMAKSMMNKAKGLLGPAEKKVYSAADMAGKTASEKQYLMQMNEYNAEAVEFEIPVVSHAIKAWEFLKKKVTAEDVGAMDMDAALKEIAKMLPKKGVLSFRFKEKAIQNLSTPPVNAKKVEWASARASAVKRAGSTVSGEDTEDTPKKQKEATPLDSILGMFQPLYVLKLGFNFVWGATCFFVQMVFSVLKFVTGQSGGDHKKIKAALAGRAK